MTLLELHAIIDRAAHFRAMAAENRRSAGALAEAGHRGQAASHRLEALLNDLQATALESSPELTLCPVPLRARAGGLRRP
jgi:hypothetical protein